MNGYTYFPRIFGCLLTALALAACGVSPPTPTVQPTILPTLTPEFTDYWPTDGWRTSTPEEKGMDSTLLAEMLDSIQPQGHPIHGIVIIRNGYLVLEAAIHPYQAGSRHYLASATKSFTSALVGIAMDRGRLDSVDQKLLNFFPDRTFAHSDARKRAITLEHILTMSSGLDWPADGLNELLWPQLVQSRDWVQFALDRPMAGEPGSYFNYNSAGTHLLSAIIQHKTGMSALDFAKKNLFTPLNISNVAWVSDPNGISWGSSGLSMTAGDMARFGYLYLKDGIWEGKHVIPADWIQASCAAHIQTLSNGISYGYGWWVEAPHVYKAAGFGGQRIFVIPDREMVVVFVGGITKDDLQNLPEETLKSFILPAVRSDEPLPANPQQRALLESRLQALAHPEPEPAPPLPALAEGISGKIYTLQANSFGFTAFTLNFSKDQASISVYAPGGTREYPIGLDGVYRLTQEAVLPESPPGTPLPSPVALKGAWLGSDTFSLSMFQEGNLTDVRFVFKNEAVSVDLRDSWGTQTVSGTAEKETYPTPPSTAAAGQHSYSSNVQIETSNQVTQTAQVNYLLYFPGSYGLDPQQKWPMILFLHGRGERGNDLELLKKHPLPKILETQPDFPFIVVAPQLPLESESWSGWIETLNALLDYIESSYSVDPHRIYLTGLSMGGYGAWDFALRYPERFAALVPIAGGYEGSRSIPENICALRSVPIWVFHGNSDTIVPPSESQVLVEALKACGGGKVRFTLYSDADHESSFLRAYADPELYQWLLEQRLK